MEKRPNRCKKKGHTLRMINPLRCDEKSPCFGSSSHCPILIALHKHGLVTDV